MYLKTVERASSQLISGFIERGQDLRMGREHRIEPPETQTGRGMIDQLRGLGSRMLGKGRSRPDLSTRPTANELLFPARPGLFNIWERRAVAAFAAIIGGHARQAQYVELLADSHRDAGALDSLLMSGGDLSHAVLAEAHRLTATPPNGGRYRVPDQLRQRLGDRIAAAIEHAWHLSRGLASDATAQARLTRAGWSTAEITALDQIIGLLIPAAGTRH